MHAAVVVACACMHMAQVNVLDVYQKDAGYEHLLDLNFHLAGFIIFKYLAVLYSLQHRSRLSDGE